LKKAVSITIYIMGGSFIAILMSLVAIFFYIHSDHFSRLIQNQVNQRIPGRMEWTKSDLSFLKGEFTLESYKLSLNGAELAAFKKVHIALDLLKMVDSFDISELFNDFDLSSILSHELIVKEFSIERPSINLAMASDQRLNILSAFPVSDKEGKEPEARDKQFREPFNITINSLTLTQGSFQYRSQPEEPNESQKKDGGNSEASKLSILIQDINFKGSGRIADKSSLSFTLSMKSAGGDLNLNGSVKNIPLEPEGDYSESSEEISETAERDSGSPEKASEPIVDITANGELIMAELMKMLGIDGEDISGNLSLNAALAGTLNDPSFSCSISYPDSQPVGDKNTVGNKNSDAKIMGRIIKKVILDIVMEKREVLIRKLEIQHPDATLKADGHISLAQAFPDGFSGKNSGRERNSISYKEAESKQTEDRGKKREIEQRGRLDSITGEIHITGKNIDTGKLLESENIKGVKGICSFNTDISGTFGNPEVRLTFKAEGAGYLNYPVVRSAESDLILSDGVVNIKRFDLTSCDSSVQLEGAVTVLEKEKSGRFKLMPMPLFDLSANSDKINITELLRQLNLLQEHHISADLAVNSHLTGTLDNPEVVLNINGKDISAAGQKFREVTLKGGYQNHRSKIDSLLITLSSDTADGSEKDTPSDVKSTPSDAKGSYDNTLEIQGVIDQNKKFKMDLYSSGIDLFCIESVKNSDVIKGVASGTLFAEGDLNSVRSSKIEGDIALKQVQIMDRPFEDFSVKIALQDSSLKLKGRLNFDVDADFDVKSRDFALQAIFKETDLTPWLTFAGVKQIQRGTVTGTIDIRGNADHTDRISGTCNLSKLSLNLFRDPAIFLNSSGTVQEQVWIRADNIRGWSDGKKFRVEKFKTMLPENGEVVLAASGSIGGPIKCQADATLPVKFASLFIPDMPAMKGAVKLNVRADMASDDIKNSDLDAYVELVGIEVALPESAGDMKLKEINGTIRADSSKIEIAEIRGKLISGRNSGEFRMSGGAKLEDFTPHDIFIKLTAKEIPVNMVDNFAAEFDTDLSFKGNPDGSTLSGSLLINHAQLTGDINVERKILSRLTETSRGRTGVNEKKEVNKLLEKMKLNIALKGREPFIVENNLAYMEIHPDIRISGTAAAPVVSGRSEINPGTITYQSNEFTLTRGIIDFVNPYKIEPELDIQSHRTVRDWDILLEVSGTPENLKFKLTSDPSLEDGDIISLLLRGKTVTELIRAEGGTTLSAASMLSQVAVSAVSNRVRSATGLDIFEVGFGNDSADNGFGDMNVTVGKEITDKITVKYSTENEDGVMVGKTSAKYKVMDNISVSGFQNSEGQFGGEVRYRLEFR